MNQPTADTIYGQTIPCPCGRTHQIEPRRIIYKKGALSLLPDVLSEWTDGRRVTVLTDLRTRRAAGREAADGLKAAGWMVDEVIVPDRAAGHPPRCDDRTHDRLLNQIGKADLILPVGSGVISDLGKWIAHDLSRPYVCFATAATMNGYTSANIAAAVRGVKILLRGSPPRIVLTDPDILLEAPYILTTAGLGDVLAKSVSSADWRMNHLLFKDYYCPRAVSLIAGLEPLYMEHPEALPRKDPETMKALFESLLLTGAAMTMAETSAPASGAEHLISHTLDMMGDRDSIPHDLHGRQVGIGTLIAAEIYQRMIKTESPDFSTHMPDPDRTFWGKLSREIEGHYSEKRPKLSKAAERLSEGDTWDRLREELHPLLRPPQEIRQCLKKAEAAYRAQDIGCSADRLITVLLHAHEIRSRFTILDLAHLSGLLPRAAAEIIDNIIS